MNRDELMQMAAEKAVKETTWETIEFLFRPRTVLELLLRLSFDETKRIVYEALGSDAPDAMPHRFRGPYWNYTDECVKKEEFYRILNEKHEGSIK